MNSLSQRLVRAAVSRGYSQANPILLTADKGGLRVNLIVSSTEPHNVRSPLNLIWINPEAETVQKRVSRESTEFSLHEWTEEFEFFEPQLWDEPIPDDQTFQELNRNVGNTHNLEIEDLDGISIYGGTMGGPLVLRQADDYADDEAVPKSFMYKFMSGLEAIVISTKMQVGSLRSSISAHARRITSLELAIGSLKSVRSFSQEYESSEQWEVEHNLDSQHVYAWITKPDGTNVVYDRIEAVDNNNCVIHFAGPVEGLAVVVAGSP